MPIITGRKIGVVIMIRGDISIKVPSTKSIRLTMSKITNGLSDMVSKVADKLDGTSVTANNQPKEAAVPIINNTIAVVFTALILAVTNPLKSSERYTRVATRKV